MKQEVRLYNVIFPIWLIWLFPQLLLFVIPGNLLIDCAVLLLTLLALKHQRKREVMKVEILAAGLHRRPDWDDVDGPGVVVGRPL